MKWKDNPYLTITKDSLLDFMIESFNELAREQAPFVSLQQSQEFIDKWVEKHFDLRRE